MFLILLPQAVLFILYLVSLTSKRLVLPFSWVPASLVANDLLDGLFFSVAAIVIFRAMFNGQRVNGFDLLPFILCLFKAVGHGTHMTANSSDVLLDHDLRAPIGAHIFFLHETVAHNLVYWSEYALLALYLYRTPPSAKGSSGSRVATVALAALGLIQGSAAARLAIGTRTVLSLSSIWLTAALLSTTSRSNASARLFAQCLTVASLGFVVYWGVKHNGSWPTFEDLAGSYKR